MVRIGSSSLIAVMLWFLSSATAFAGVLTGELDKSEGSLEDQFVYTLVIQGSFDDDPQFPVVDGLEVHAAGKSQNISIVNGKYSREVQVQFVLTPSKAGTYNIPPLSMKVDGKVMQTLPLEMKVSATSGSGGGSASGSAAGPASAQGEEGIFVERSFSKNSVYVGEAIGVKIKVYNRVKVVGAQPDFKYPSAFQIKNIEGQKTYTQMRGNAEYNVTELDAVLIPTREGDFTIEPAILVARVAVSRRQRSRSFFDDLMGPTELQEKRLRSDAATIKVLPLPLAGRRKDFSGLVGEFAMSAGLNPQSGNAGDTLNLTVNIQGLGASSGMSDLTLPFDSSVAKVYKDKPETREELDAEKGITSEKTFKYAIVPGKPGHFPLGKLVVQVFDPKKAAYQDLVAELGSIEIGGQALAGTTPVPGAPETDSQTAPVPPAAGKAPTKVEQKKVAVELIGKDLVEPHSQRMLSSSDQLTQSDWMIGGLLLALGMTGLGASGWLAMTKAPPEELLRIQRANKAFKLSKKQLDAAHHCLQKQDLAAALRMAQGCFKDYTGAKFGVTGAAVTLRDIEGYLRSKEVDRDTLLELREVWSALDQMIYAPPLGQNPSRGEELLMKTRKVLEQMERQC
ncbi:MAG: protein BatD [Oligoflexus sp.]|nr:protein BatD [Oligoflexus sp.]